MKSTTIFCVFVILMCSMTFQSQSQIAISNLAEISKIKSGTTFVAMKDPSSEKAKEFIEVFKNNWTISKVECIKYSDIENHLAPENSFVTIGGYETTAQFVDLYSNGSRRNGINFSNTHIYLELWTCNDNYFQKEKRKKGLRDKDKIQVARIELYTDYETLSNPDNIFQSDFDGDKHIRNWGPGILKNYIQSLMGYLNKNQTHGLYSGITNLAELKNLKNGILYVPDYTLIKFNKFTGDENKKHDEKDLFEDFRLKYKLVTIEELNQKILNDKTGFYYLVYVKSSTDKYVSVINSLTGEIIYSSYSPASYTFKSDDLSDLQRKVH